MPLQQLQIVDELHAVVVGAEQVADDLLAVAQEAREVPGCDGPLADEEGEPQGAAVEQAGPQRGARPPVRAGADRL